MAKYYGKVGYVVTNEVSQGVWEDTAIEVYYFGDIIRNNRRIEPGASVNENLNISNQISIVADPYAYSNFQWMRYIEFMGSLWKITNVEVQHPRLILTIGGVYNGITAGT